MLLASPSKSKERFDHDHELAPLVTSSISATSGCKNSDVIKIEFPPVALKTAKFVRLFWKMQLTCAVDHVKILRTV